MRLNLRRRFPQDQRRRILDHLIGEFCDDYDLNARDMSDYFQNGDRHLGILVRYLTDKGYAVSTYSLLGVDKTVLSWGLEFDDGCELTLALRLRYSDG